MAEYAYLIGNIFFLAVWLILFLHRKDLRREMLIMSLLVTPLGVSQLLFYRDYFRPSYFFRIYNLNLGLEDFIFCFAVGGIVAVIYEEIFAKRYSKRCAPRRPKFLVVVVVSAIISLFIGNFILGYNSIYISSAIMIISGLAITFVRHDLFKEAMISGLLMGLLMFVFYFFYFLPLSPSIIEEWWLLDNISRVLILGVPIEELLWGFSWGFLAGPIYEFILGLKIGGRTSGN